MARLVTLTAVLLVVAAEKKSGLYKVALTQIGYIQFLKYDVQLPDLQDFTFCIWVKSNNFTYPHPLFSYSRHETQRLVRSWLDPKGFVMLEVLENNVMSVPIDFVPGFWYNICQTWNNIVGQWLLHINGRLAAAGHNWKLRGAIIPRGGDVVVGQEYTDFDKGLDDGIEGEVFGFNLVSSFNKLHWLNEELVQNSFYQCAARRGSPMNNKHLLIAWASTPVRVFGGAVIKSANPTCGDF
ncbi:hypothetical protein L9F63_009603 [Diploptera punctata]|uniref:Pentraxin family member n=1 Tax=Diploptera punctata TaxID=6984 RepID=A0AAD8AKY7_DIPPU|nr:hypothetical protein L9F63_009603 [Diploptera punctata]